MREGEKHLIFEATLLAYARNDTYSSEELPDLVLRDVFRHTREVYALVLRIICHPALPPLQTPYFHDNTMSSLENNAEKKTDDARNLISSSIISRTSHFNNQN